MSEEVARAFIQHYYPTADSGAENLASLFQPGSMMTFEGQQFQGPEAIVGKLKQLGQVRHSVRTQEVQPSLDPSKAMLIFVTGVVNIGADGNPLHFSQMFQLVSTGPNAFYVHNSFFRLNYGQ